MALPDLKGLQIQETYQRVVHTDGTNYFNGSGSALPNLITGVTAGSNAFELKFTLGNGLEQTVTIPQVATSGTPPPGGYPELVYTDDLDSLVQGVTLSNGFFSNSLQLNVFKYNGGATATTINIDPFPYEGNAEITGSLSVSGSVNLHLPTSSNETYFLTYNTASFELEAREVATLINPKVEYLDLTASISSGTSITLPNNLSYISSSTYEYLEVFFNGLRLRYDRDFIPTSTTTIQTQIAFPSGSELTFKSLKA